MHWDFSNSALVKGIEVGMLQGFPGRDSVGWVQRDHFDDQVERVLGETGEERCWALRSELWEGRLEVLELAYSSPIHLAGSPVELEDLENLVNLGIAHEQRLLGDQL